MVMLVSIYDTPWAFPFDTPLLLARMGILRWQRNKKMEMSIKQVDIHVTRNFIK
jgi:hypothetical protein